jgi:hypothetical protein
VPKTVDVLALLELELEPLVVELEPLVVGVVLLVFSLL